MGGQRRYFAPGLPVHVMQRGNNRQIIFRTASDREHYLYWLRRSAERYGLQIHAWVLMDNHTHLLVTPAEECSLARSMQLLGSRYVRWFNTRHDRTGTLFEGRYRSSVITDDRYYFACSRYIELNPVRAGMVSQPVYHEWSSFHIQALGQVDPLWQPHPLYLDLGKSPTSRQNAY